MKLYSAPSASPKRVSIFLAEKNVEIPSVQLSLLKGESRTPAMLRVNSLGEVPVLELDDGRILTESAAICRYLEAKYPDPPLMGAGAFDQAHVEMWSRRVELQILRTLSDIVEHTFPVFAQKIEQIPGLAEAQRRAAPKKWAWLNDEMSDSRPYIAGDQFTLADITGMAALVVSDFLEIEWPETLRHLSRWSEKVRSRPSWSA